MKLEELKRLAPIGKKVTTTEWDISEVASEVNNIEEIKTITAREDCAPADYISRSPYSLNDISQGFPMTFYWIREKRHQIIVKGYAVYENDEAFLLDNQGKQFSLKLEGE